MSLRDDPTVVRRLRGNPGRASRVKGRKGEIEARKMLEQTFGRVAGINYGQARTGGIDITFPLAVPIGGRRSLNLEVKRRKAGLYGSTLSQARAQLAAVHVEGDVDVVMARQDNDRWTVTLDADWFFMVLSSLEMHQSLKG